MDSSNYCLMVDNIEPNIVHYSALMTIEFLLHLHSGYTSIAKKQFSDDSKNNCGLWTNRDSIKCINHLQNDRIQWLVNVYDFHCSIEYYDDTTT